MEKDVNHRFDDEGKIRERVYTTCLFFFVPLCVTLWLKFDSGFRELTGVDIMIENDYIYVFKRWEFLK